MSASAVQYVRGMPVVKIFGQSVRSFRQFNAEIEAYKTYALKVCDTYESGMTLFYRTAQFDCHLHSPCRYFTNAK